MGRMYYYYWFFVLASNAISFTYSAMLSSDELNSLSINDLSNLVVELNHTLQTADLILQKRTSPFKYYLRHMTLFYFGPFCILLFYIITSFISYIRKPVVKSSLPLNAIQMNNKEKITIYRHSTAKYDLLRSPHMKTINNLYDFFRSAVDRYPNTVCMTQSSDSDSKSAQVFTYHEILERINHLIIGLTESNISLHEEEHDSKNGNTNIIGISSSTNVEWFISMLTCYALGYVSLLLSSTYSLSIIGDILWSSKVQTIICENEDDMRRLLDAQEKYMKSNATKQFHSFKNVILMSTSSPEKANHWTIQTNQNDAINVYTLENFELQGKQKQKEFESAATLVSSIRTSSSNNNHNTKNYATLSYLPSQHGIFISHDNIISTIYALQEDCHFTEGTEVYVSYISPTYLFEDVLIFAILNNGGKIDFINHATNQKLKTTIPESSALILNSQRQPTILLCTPFLVSQILTQLQSSNQQGRPLLPSWLASLVYNFVNIKALQWKGVEYIVNLLIVVCFPLRHHLGLSKCQTVLFHSSFEVEKKWKETKFYNVLGYYLKKFVKNQMVLFGTNETSGIYALGKYSNNNTSAIATMENIQNAQMIPLACNEICLEDAPVYGYWNNKINGDECGIVIVRGYNISNGYYHPLADAEKLSAKMSDSRKEKKKKQTLEWFRTTEIGRYNCNKKQIVIVDNVDNYMEVSKNIKLPIYKIEKFIEQSPYVQQAVVCPNVKDGFLLAYIYPKRMESESKKESNEVADDEEKYKSTIHQNIIEICQMNKLHGYEIVQKIYLVNKPLRQLDEMMSPRGMNKKEKLIQNLMQRDGSTNENNESNPTQEENEDKVLRMEYEKSSSDNVEENSKHEVFNDENDQQMDEQNEFNNEYTQVKEGTKYVEDIEKENDENEKKGSEMENVQWDDDTKEQNIEKHKESAANVENDSQMDNENWDRENNQVEDKQEQNKEGVTNYEYNENDTEMENENIQNEVQSKETAIDDENYPHNNEDSEKKNTSSFYDNETSNQEKNNENDDNIIPEDEETETQYDKSNSVYDRDAYPVPP